MAPGTGTGMDIDKSGEFMFVEIDDPTTIRTYIFDEETRMGYPDPKKNAVDEGNDTGETQMTKKSKKTRKTINKDIEKKTYIKVDGINVNDVFVSKFVNSNKTFISFWKITKVTEKCACATELLNEKKDDGLYYPTVNEGTTKLAKRKIWGDPARFRVSADSVTSNFACKWDNTGVHCD